MSLYGAFSSSVLGMLSQSRALNTISTNIANVSTGGFKGSETRFSTLVSSPLFNESDLSGIKPHQTQRIDQQGLLQASESDLDLAINGNGFFILSRDFDVDTDNLMYGRDGSFQMKTLNDVQVTADDGSTITVKDGYLADKNGYYVLGWEAESDGTFPTSDGTLTPLRIDAYAFVDSFDPTTNADLVVNLPANGDTNSTEEYAVSIVDSGGTSQAVKLQFYKSHVANQWIVVPVTDGTGTTQVDTVTLGGTAEAGDRYAVTVNNSTVSYRAQQNDTVTLSGTVEAGDVYTVTIDGTPVSYTAVGGDTLDDIRDALITSINSASLGVTADVGGAAIIAVGAESAFTLTASATDGGGTADNATATTTATDSLSDIRDELITKLAGNSSIASAVTAAASGTGGITLTATAAATPFSASSVAVDGGSTDDNTATTTTNATVLTFGGDGYLSSPSGGEITLSMDFSGGSTASVTFDVSEMTQFDGAFLPVKYSANGYASSKMSSFKFDDQGRVVGVFEDSTQRALYKLPLATFSNPNSLEEKNGNVFAPTENSGDASVVAAGTEGAGQFQPNSRELSNVDIASEFTRMIVTQQAYNSSATVFKTLDEITQTTRDLKR